MTRHTLSATPATTRIGVFDAAIPPVLTVRSGDKVVIECVSGSQSTYPPSDSNLKINPALCAINAVAPPVHGGHILTGPVAVVDAEPGDTLEVRIEAIAYGSDWGYCGFRPLMGTLPEDFPSRRLSHFPIDRDRNICRFHHGVELPLAPFFGVMGVAPPPVYGAISTIEPREHGGNMDNKELQAGSALFLPVWVSGALFSVGDGHGLQGDGEVCVNALETCLTGTFTLRLHKRRESASPLTYPRAETATHHISMGFDVSLDGAIKRALREMIAFVVSRTAMSREDAYQFCSLAADFRITQTVNNQVGVHGMLNRSLLAQAQSGC